MDFICSFYIEFKISYTLLNQLWRHLASVLLALVLYNTVGKVRFSDIESSF